ncbi:hypothetical protein PASE110613_05430 [Paenibacillus sediminis]|uniref:DNA-binding transcriptional MocR family regulator n=1 Tax=Paenibacillus sediminis TaxID=664909 RepID=A0ABS4H1S5_9BACL|nr:hypothetical protein [Paenibacillus sediminis]MBP1936217.1 DNA-binding transcriptional MocR family regulator [Paenibacillus sediminis]
MKKELELAELEGIKVYTLRQMWTAYEEAKNPYLFIGFASLTFDQIEQGIKKLSEIWFR